MFNTVSNSNDHIIGNCNHTSGGGGGWGIYCNGAGVMKFNSYGNGWNTGDTNIGWSANTWHHVAVTRKGSTVKIFLDGLEKYSASKSSATLGGSNNLAIGSDNGVTSSMDFNGQLDEIRISNFSRYNSGFTPSTTKFVTDNQTVVLIHSDDIDGSQIFTSDQPTSHMITPITDVKHSNYANLGWGTSAISFDGTGDYLEIADHADWTFSNDFCIEFWMRLNAIQGNAVDGSSTKMQILEHRLGGSNGQSGWNIQVDSNNGTGCIIEFSAGNSSTTFGYCATYSGTGKPHEYLLPHTNYHLAYQRHGNNFCAWINGIPHYTNTSSAVMSDFATPVWIGKSSHVLSNLDGYMKEIRISDTARYTHNTNFTPYKGEFTSDANTKLLIHSTESSESTTFTDSGNTGHTVNGYADVKHAVAEKKFGTSSIYFGESNQHGNYLEVPTHTSFDFGADNHTIEWWQKVAVVNAYPGAGGGITYGRPSSSNNGGQSDRNWLIYHQSNGAIQWYMYGSPGNNIGLAGTTNVCADLNWHHIACVREGGSMKIYVDGTLDATNGSVGTFSMNSIGSAESKITVGTARPNIGNSDEEFQGWIDEFRISKGARYTSNFTPATSAFTTDSNTVLLIHGDGTGNLFTDDSYDIGKQTQLHGWAVNYGN